ncbi:ABC transporter substrate-binding protein [Cohnella hongkongensis]|uniref:ABC transporter substrate-binding protein n=1 Tax=Cohnella hongkongensis TaxID=178337 RepID=A0ABV9FBR5_9BACL
MNAKIKLSLLLVLAFAILAAGCSSGKEGGNPASSPSQAASSSGHNENQGKADLPPYEITMVYMANESEDQQRVAEAMSKITKEKINATVKLMPINAGAWSQQVNLMLASQEKIDVIMTSSIYGFSTQATSGNLLSLDELLAKYGQGISDLMDKAYLGAGKVNGAQYAIPVNKDMATQGGIILRKDLADKHGIDVSAIQSLDDLDAVFETIKKNEPSLLPVAIATPNTLSPVDMLSTSDQLVDGIGVLPGYDNGLKIENPYERPEYAELLKKMREWYQKGYFSKDAATNTEPPAELVKAGRAFSFFNAMKVGSSESQTIRTGMPMIAIPLTKAYSTTSHVANFMHSIPLGSKDPERAMMFMDLLYTDKELINLLNWGIEGEHYVKKADDVIDYPEGVDIRSVKYTTNNQSFMFGNQFLNYVWPNQLPDIWEQTEQFNRSAEKSKALGFTFDTTPVKSEVGAVNNVKQQFKGGLESGTLDPDKVLPEFLDRLKQAGMDKIIAEKQRQLDAWAQTLQ